MKENKTTKENYLTDESTSYSNGVYKIVSSGDSAYKINTTYKAMIDNNIIAYDLLIKSETYNRLLAIQTSPAKKYWFKNKEVTKKQIIDILESVDIKNINK